MTDTLALVICAAMLGYTAGCVVGYFVGRAAGRGAAIGRLSEQDRES